MNASTLTYEIEALAKQLADAPLDVLESIYQRLNASVEYEHNNIYGHTLQAKIAHDIAMAAYFKKRGY